MHSRNQICLITPAHIIVYPRQSVLNQSTTMWKKPQIVESDKIIICFLIHAHETFHDVGIMKLIFYLNTLKNHLACANQHSISNPITVFDDHLAWL